MTTAKEKLFSAIDELAGKARSMYFVPELAKYMIGRGKVGIAPLASNPGVQFLQSGWFSSMLGKMTGGGGTRGKNRLWQILCGLVPAPVDKDTGKAWTESERLTVVLDVLLFRAFPSAISLVAHMSLSALSDTMLKAEAKRRWGAKVAMAFVAWHKASVTFLDAITEVSESSPAKRKNATEMPSMSSLTAHSKARAGKKKSKPSSRPAAPSAELIAAAERVRAEQASNS